MNNSKNLKRYANLTMVIGGAVLALSGLCTGVFVASGPDEYVPNALGVIGMGLIGIIPGAILFFSARNILKKGPKYLPAILILLITIPLFLGCLLQLFSMFRRFFNAAYSSVGFFIIFTGVTLCVLAMVVFGIKTIRAARSGPKPADEF